MSKFGSLYIEVDSFFHRMNPVIKLFIFIMWAISVFMFLDIRVDLFLLLLGLILLDKSKLPYRMLAVIFIVVVVFNVINSLSILILSPDYGVVLTHKKTVIFSIGDYSLYYQTLMYTIVISLKYLSLLPIMLIFIFTTHPSKLSCSLNMVAVPYTLAYTFNIIFRYFPDIQNEFRTISNAQAARGLSYSKDEKSKIKRIKNLFTIIIPLIKTSLDRIDGITNAMELRCFGKHNKRTWYNQTVISVQDIISLVITLIVFILLLFYRHLVYTGFNYRIF